MTLLLVQGLSKRFGGTVATENVGLTVEEGSITGLIGPNGAGKTTCFAMISGFVRPDAGTVRFLGKDVTGETPHRLATLGLARTFQIVRPFRGLSVLENIAVGAHLRLPARKDALLRAREVAGTVGLLPLLERPAGSLTVAARKRLELARALATGPRLLLLDEVLAGLNPSEVEEILPKIEAIRAAGVTILMIEHVMQAVMRLCERVYVLHGGRMVAEGAPPVVCNDQRVIEAYLGRGAAERLGGAPLRQPLQPPA